MKQLRASITRLLAGTDGQDLIEYGMLAALIAIAALVAVSSLGSTIESVLWDPIGSSI
jgi:Flp pilus assembly pilin Flp